MARAIFKVFFSIMKAVANIFLAPVNLLVANFLPDLTQMISKFNLAVNYYLGGGLSYFAHILPPTTRNVIVIYLMVLVGYYTISAAVHIVLKVITIIKNIKIW